MDPITQQVVLAAAAGTSAAADATYVDDVFSTYVYEGNGSARTITNGIDLSGKGGLVWLKSRTNSEYHALADTERGANKILHSNETDPEFTTNTNIITGFSSNGFSVGTDNMSNSSLQDYVSWSFRKAPGFFDVVTYTGDGSNPRTISHSLGSKPGMILVKTSSGTAEWHVYHQSQGATKYGTLNENYVFVTNSNRWGDTEPTSTEFTVDVQANVDESTYVAYLFAHDDQSFGTNGDESIIKCGTYEGNGGTLEVDLGFEPQWLMIKNIDSASDQYGDADWTVYDMMRGFNDQDSKKLHPNLTSVELSGGRVVPTPTGFKIDNESNIDINASGDTYIYMAIRRPHKPPTAATEVFNPVAQVGTVPNFVANFPVDFAIRLLTASGNTTLSQSVVARLTGETLLATSQSNAELDVTQQSYSISWDHMDGWGDFGGSSTALNFKRAPGFMDVVAYAGTASAQTLNHGLGVIPEMMIVKRRSDIEDWLVYHKDTGNQAGTGFATNSTFTSISAYWDSTTPTSTTFRVGTHGRTNTSGYNYIAYLFATLPGISKVGSYSGSTGSNIDVDCGFSAGARLVLIKRITFAGSWYLWDTTRGIVSGNDPYILLDSTAAQITDQDNIDPINSGFRVVSTLGALNATGSTYLFLAIA